jgi:outer membrane receptor protein involved in Fe transport
MNREERRTMKNGILKGNLVRVVLGLAMALIWGTANAEEDETATLDPVVVTADWFPVKEKESSRFVSVYTSEELKETGADNLVDALRRKGSFAYNALGPLGINHGGMNSTLSIRGVADGELILINGSPIQGVAGQGYDLSAIPIEQIERVEVMRGAASTLYGADAMSGVINIITKKNPSKTSTQASVELGNYQYVNGNVGFQSEIVNAGFNYQHLEGITEISRSFSGKYTYDTDALNKYSLNLDITPFENFHIDYLGSYYKTGFNKIYDSGKATESTRQEDYNQFADIRYETNSVRAKAFGSYSRINRDEYTDPDEPESKNTNYNYGLEGDYRHEIFSTELAVGGDYTHRAADYNNQYGKHHRNDYALFAQLKREFFNRLMLSVGAREQFINADSEGDDYNIFLPTFGANFEALDNLNLFANVGKAFRAPTFNNLYYNSSFLVGNPNLKPEMGWTYEAGVKFDIPFSQIRLAGFYMDYSDKIEIDRSQGYPLTYFNAGNYKSTGIEWQIDVFPFANQTNFWNDISFYTGGYWADPTAEDVNGEEYQTGPKFKTSLGASYLSENLVLQLIADILTAREDNLDTNATLDFYGKYKVWKGFITAAVSNIFNSEIQVSGDLSSSASNNYVYYGMDRMFKIGYQISF